jgi:hypothetical protein
MKKIIGIIFYILSALTTIFWLLAIRASIFVKKCVDIGCYYSSHPYTGPTVWYKSPETILILIIIPLLAFLFYRIGKKLRK